jgi:hypothetical protein
MGGTTAPTQFFADSYVPSGTNNSGTTPANLGIVVASTQAAHIVGIRFYKLVGQNSGTHVGYVWRESDQTLLGSVTFTGETASGWQTATLPTPIAVTAGANYRAAYSTTSTFAYQPTWPGITVAPFTAASGGVYATAAVGTYPASVGTDWYLVDIVWSVP